MATSTTCNHTNLTILQTQLFTTEMGLGNRPSGGDEPGKILSYDVECHDCGFEKHYSESRVPKWVVDRCNEWATTNGQWKS